MISRIGSKKIGYSLERTAYSKDKKNFYSWLSAKRYHFGFAQCPTPKCPEPVEGPLTAKKGFTLVEVMVATAVLSLGIVLLYEAFFKITDAFGYYNHYLSVSPFAREKIWAAQDAFSKSGDQASVETSGKFIQRGKDFNWNISYGLLDETPDSFLYKIDLVIVWKEGLRKGKLLRSAYAFYTKKK